MEKAIFKLELIVKHKYALIENYYPQGLFK